MFKDLRFITAVIVLIFLGFSTLAQDDDVEGSEDHSMISRFEGSVITDYEHYNYDRQELVTGVNDGGFERTVYEGEVTRLHYLAPEGRSPFEVYSNYKNALRNAGFEIVFECIGDDAKWDLVPNDAPLGYGNVYRRGSNRNYALARLAKPKGDILVAVHSAKRHDDTRALLLIVEEKPLTTGMVKVELNAKAIAEKIDEKGSVRIYGIHFDTDKATIKKESESTLTEIASFLEQKQKLKLGVVGHTDATGGMQHNMDLSMQRAEAVVEALTTSHGISGERLTPYGVGPLAPVAGNDDEDGRARNRRVELIKMPEE